MGDADRELLSTAGSGISVHAGTTDTCGVVDATDARASAIASDMADAVVQGLGKMALSCESAPPLALPYL